MPTENKKNYKQPIMNKGTKISNAKNKIEEFLNTNEKSLAKFYNSFGVVCSKNFIIFCFIL